MRRTFFFTLLGATAIVVALRAFAEEPQPTPIGAGCFKECCVAWCEERFPGQQKEGLMEAFADEDGLCTCEPVIDWARAEYEAAHEAP